MVYDGEWAGHHTCIWYNPDTLSYFFQGLKISLTLLLKGKEGFGIASHVLNMKCNILQSTERGPALCNDIKDSE